MITQCEIKYMKYDIISRILNTNKISLFLCCLISIELIILVEILFNDIGLYIFGFFCWIFTLSVSYIKAKKYCNSDEY